MYIQTYFISQVTELEKSLEGMMSGGHLTKTELEAMIKDLKEKEDQLTLLIATAQVYSYMCVCVCVCVCV